jgi:formylglycine-generating enzyme required for sulfatase activity
MNTKLCSFLVCVLLKLTCLADTPVSPTIHYDASNPTNQVQLTWEAMPTKQYRVLTTTALGQPWQTLTNTPLVASNNLVHLWTPADTTARFYKVSKLDTEPPKLWRMVPASNAIAVPRQSQLQIYLNEETGIATNSIALTVGTNPPATLADPRLTLAGNILTYTPFTNQFLGTNGQTITNKLIIADTLGYRATNTWPFKLELVPILASNVMLIGATSPLTLLSTNGSTFVFSYSGVSSGLTNGEILVSTDTNLLYKIRVLSLTDNPGSKTVSLVTTQAALAECLLKGTIRLTGSAATLPPPNAPRKDLVLPLGNTVIYDNGTINIQVLSGQISFDPSFSVAGEFQNGRLTSFDSDISATLGLDMTLEGSFQDSGDWNGSKPLMTPKHSFKVLGFVGPVPVWVESVLELNIGYEAHAEAKGSVTWGFTSSRTLTFGVRLRNGQWSDFAQQSSSFTSFPPSWQINGAATVKGYLQPKLTIYLESLAGPSADLKPYLELEGKTCVQPGQSGIDLSLYAGLSSTLGIDVRGWDSQWGNLPSWQLFNLRELLWHDNLATSIGPPPQTIPNLVWIPCGTFTMGSPAGEPTRFDDEGPQTLVTITHGFWMGRYELTQGEYLAVMGSNPSFCQGVREINDPTCGCVSERDYGTDLSRPVENVNWYEAVAYCAALTSREQNAGRLPAGYVYRLPTEAEWEYACRAGTTTPFNYGSEMRSGMANFIGVSEYPPCGASAFSCHNPNGIYLGGTISVGSYAPNAWGLYDMHGNVNEFCQDWWSSSLPGGSVTDPHGPATGSYRVHRGGNWDGEGEFLRSAFRDGPVTPSFRDPGIGFRVVLAKGQ